LVGSGAAYVINGGFRYNIEFAGGTELRLSFDNPMKIGALRKAVSDNGWDGAVIQSLGTTGNSFLVRVSDKGKSIEADFKEKVGRDLSDNKFAVVGIVHVGAEAGKEVQWNAIKAILLALLVLLGYLAIRSRYAYALGAVAALAHDLLVIVGFLLIAREQISLTVLAAVLSILGYSINDTIVIFSRIKENRGLLKGGATPSEVVNTSLNQTMRRTLLTSFSTLLAVGTLFFLGGEVLRSFSMVMLVGITLGTYSSIYIASPVMLAFASKKL
jgi:preprotein translocase SecF subunit